MRHIATVADSNVESQLADWAASLRVQGWEDTLHVFAPGNDVPDVPDGCEIIPLRNPYSGISKGTALLKPAVFRSPRWAYQDEVLYLDCADLVVMCDPSEIFDQLQDAVCAAREFSGRNLHGTIPDAVQESMGLDRDLVWTKRLLNSGVIVGRIGPTMRDAAQMWRNLCEQVPETSGWPSYEPGDQICFNYVFRTLQRHNRTRFLTSQYNYRGGRNVGKLQVKSDHVETRSGTPVYVPHATGPGRLPAEIVRVATDRRARRVPPEQISCTTITPAYHAGDFIGRCLESIARQTILPEHVLVGIDACEDTAEAFPECVPEPIVDCVDVFYFPQHQGPYKIRNTLAAMVDTNAIVFFDADDEMDPMCIHDQLALLRPKTVVYPLGRWEKDGRITNRRHRAHGAFTIYTADFHALHGFEPRLCGMDTEFWIRAQQAGYGRRVCDRVNYTRHKHGENLTERRATRPGSMIRRRVDQIISEHRQSGYERNTLATAHCEAM